MMNQTKHSTIIANAVSNAIEKEVAPWQKKYPEGHLQLPYDPTDGKTFQNENAILLMCIAADKGYSDPRWLTSTQAKSKGWSIKDGEKGTPVKYFIKDDNNKSIIKYHYVFNAGQINGIPAIENILNPQGKKEPNLIALMDRLKINYEKTYEDNDDGSIYDPQKHKITAGYLATQDDLYKTIISALLYETKAYSKCLSLVNTEINKNSTINKHHKTRNYLHTFESQSQDIANFLHAAAYNKEYTPTPQWQYTSGKGWTSFDTEYHAVLKEIKHLIPEALKDAVRVNNYIDSFSDSKHQVTAFVPDSIVNTCKNNTAPWMKEYPEGHLQLPYNPTTGKTFSDENALLLMCTATEKGYSDSRWCSLIQAQEQGWTIKQEEKGIPIQNFSIDDNKKVSMHNEYVFNASQIDNIPSIENTLKPVVHERPDILKILEQFGINSFTLSPCEDEYGMVRDNVIDPANLIINIHPETTQNDLYHSFVQLSGKMFDAKGNPFREYSKIYNPMELAQLEKATCTIATFLHAAKYQESYSPYTQDKEFYYEPIKHLFIEAIHNACDANSYLTANSRKIEKSQEIQTNQKQSDGIEM